MIVAPESRTETWARVFATWCPDLIVTHLCGSTKSRELIRETLIVGRNGAIRTHVTVVSYQDMATDAAFLKSVKWSSLILDLRRSNTGVASGSGEGDFGWRFETVDSIGADHRIVTIDTPFIGNLEKLQNLMRFVDPEKFPNDSTSWDQLEGGHCDEIMSSIFDEIKPYFLKRVKKDVSDHLESKVCQGSSEWELRDTWLKFFTLFSLNMYPNQVEVLVPVELTKMQKRVYRAKLMVRRPALAVSRSDNNNNIHLDIISDLLQVCGYPEPVGELGLDGVNGDEVYKTMFVSESAKIRCVRYMLAHLKCKGHKVVIFSSYSNTLDAVEKLLQIEQHVYCRLVSLKVMGCYSSNLFLYRFCLGCPHFAQGQGCGNRLIQRSKLFQVCNTASQSRYSWLSETDCC